MERINILWTGGFDSTFRVCQLSLLEIVIQPIYISIKRESEPYELKAIAEITDYINSRKESRCTLLPVNVVNYEDIASDKQVTDSLMKLKEEFKIGLQYDYLTRYARQQNIMLEVGFEYDPLAGEQECFEKYGKLKKETIPVSGGKNIEYYELDPWQSSQDIINVFGKYRYGLPLYHMDRTATVQAYKEMGYEEVIPMTWFCAHPINGKPCGLCTPCEGYMESNMSFRLPLRARLLYRIFKANSLGRSVDKKIKAIYNKRWRSRDYSNDIR